MLANPISHLDVKGAVGRLQLLLARDEGHPGGVKVGEREGLASVFGIGNLRNGGEGEWLADGLSCCMVPLLLLGVGNVGSGNMPETCIVHGVALTMYRKWGQSAYGIMLGFPHRHACLTQEAHRATCTHFQLSFDPFKGYWGAEVCFNVGQRIDVDIRLQGGANAVSTGRRRREMGAGTCVQSRTIMYTSADTSRRAARLVNITTQSRLVARCFPCRNDDPIFQLRSRGRASDTGTGRCS